MKRIFLSLIIIFSLVFFASAQATDALKTVYDDAEFFLLSEEYIDALIQYNKIYKRGFENNANINYKIGLCYLNLPGEKDKSIAYLEKASQNISVDYKEGILKETKAPVITYFYLGTAYRINNKLDDAIKSFGQLKTVSDPKKDAELIYFADKEISKCKEAKEFKKKPVQINLTNLGDIINTTASNYRPVVSGDETSIVYMSKLKFYDGVFYSIKKGDKWSYPTNLTPQIRSDGNQYTCSLSYDGKTLYLAKEDFFNSDIYTSNFAKGKWSVSEPLNKNINTKYWESHACVSKDGHELYFTSNRKDKTAKGQMDIYVSEKDENGEWGLAVNLGSVINTEFNEETPFITSDGKRLYFSSQGHDNMGGYDVFYSDKKIDGSWSEPVNIGYPISTTDDDLFFVPMGNGSHAYISQYDKDGFGKEDIFYLEIFSKESSNLDMATLEKEKELNNLMTYHNNIILNK